MFQKIVGCNEGEGEMSWVVQRSTVGEILFDSVWRNHAVAHIPWSQVVKQA